MKLKGIVEATNNSPKVFFSKKFIGNGFLKRERFIKRVFNRVTDKILSGYLAITPRIMILV
jgi:hypothetical protein